MPVSQWMLATGAISLVLYAVVAALLILNKGALPPVPVPQPGEAVRIDPPAWHGQLQPVVLMIAGFFALISLGEPFARDMWKILKRNVSFNASGLKRFRRSLEAYSSELLTRNRGIAIGSALALYAVIGVALFAVGLPRLTGIWTWLLVVGAGVFVARSCCSCCSRPKGRCGPSRN